MNKKFKLFSTIASLCLAVALMAFGVYAATSVNFSINTDVSFTATAHVQASVSVQDSNAYGATEKKMNTAQTGTISRTDAGVDQGDLANKVFALSTVALTEADYKYEYTVEITNNAERDLGVAQSSAVETKEADGYKVTLTQGAASIGTNEKSTWTVVVEITDFTGSGVTIAEADIALAFTLTGG